MTLEKFASVDASTDIAALTLRLRVLVLALGEVSKWWRTEYLSPTGLRFLERLYPRTAFSAALHAATTAARPIHDASTGSSQIYHLFRLPIQLEREIHELLSETQGKSLAEEMKPALGDMELLMTKLRPLALEVSNKAVGALRVGGAADVYQEKTYQYMAGAYLRAFHTGDKIFPYVEVA
jgi:hypothetical protein